MASSVQPLQVPGLRSVRADSALPFAAAWRLGERQQRRSLVAGLIGTLLLHGATAAHGLSSPYEVSKFAREVLERTQAALTQEYDIDLQQAKLPEPEPPPPEPEPEPEPEAPPPPKPVAPDEPPPPPPAAAQAAQVLAAEADPNEPVDLTGNTFVVGTAETYSGGVTASTGTSKAPVYEQAARPSGVVGGTGTAPKAVPGPDRSRTATPVSTDWNCAFPPESEIEQINYMRVMVSLQVAPDGRVKSANVLNDPGFGFGRAARQCALRQTFRPALDREGRAIAQTLPTAVTFTR